MTTQITYANLLDIEQKRRQKIRQMANNYVGTNPGDLQVKRWLEALEKRLRRMRYGLNDHEKDIVQRWNARQQKRVLQKHVYVPGISANSRKI